MTTNDLIEAAVLGVLEGVTEFIPVSSTAHLLLAAHFLGFESSGKAFEVLIQLGAILAVVAVYFGRLWHVLVSLPTDPGARRFALGVIIAFLPAAILGALLHDFIKKDLFTHPEIIALTLVVGGVLLIWIDHVSMRARYMDAMQFPLRVALGIGLFQCLALLPGTSRSGATIIGALLLGCDRKAAAEFSFFLAIPTMLGAFVYDLYKTQTHLSYDDGVLIAVGFVTAFISALIVVRGFIAFVGRHGFTLFGWWRILVGGATLAALFLTG